MKDRRKSQPQCVAKPHGDRLPMMVIVAVWLLAILLIDPRGDFPLNDDWVYARSVVNLLDQHRITMLGTVTMTLLAQVLWGAMFCVFPGASFNALRFSTLVASIIGLLVFYKLLREVGVSPWMAALAALAVALNPLYLSLSCTFMTDVPFTTALILSAFYYLRALKNDSVRMIAWATIFSIVAVLIRQIGLALPAAFAAAYIIGHGWNRRSLVRSLTPILVTIGVLLGYQFAMSHTSGLPEYYGLQSKAIPGFFAGGFGMVTIALVESLRITSVYFGLFLLPYLAITFPGSWRIADLRNRLVSLIVSVAAMAVFLWFTIVTGWWMPFCRKQGDIIKDIGIGPRTLYDTFYSIANNPPTAPHWIWMCVTIAGLIGGVMLIWYLIVGVQVALGRRCIPVSREQRMSTAFALLGVLLLIGPAILVASSFGFFDRYMLPALPLVILMVSALSERPVRHPKMLVLPVVAYLAVIGLFTVTATHDYVSWNRTRWHALRSLMSEYKAPPSKIDGGYEFNGWYNYDKAKDKLWCSIDRDYVVTFGPMDGYETLKSYAYASWMPAGEGTICVLRKLQ